MNKKDKNLGNFWNFGFFNLFKEFEEEINSLMNNNLTEYQAGGPITYGYSINIGPETNYQPEIRQWGNLNDFRKKHNLPELEDPFELHQTPQLPKNSNSSDPYFDIIDEDDYLKVIVEVPGFTKETLAIEIDEEGSEIILKGNVEDRELNTSIQLPSKIEAKGTKSSITNGILEIRGKKRKNSSKHFKLKID
ncbi:Hsp20/alpha crystallin family protein [Candidatus Hodarchaeum mangrovi]